MVATWTRRHSWRTVAIANVRAGALFGATPCWQAGYWHRLRSSRSRLRSCGQMIGVAAAVATMGAAVAHGHATSGHDDRYLRPGRAFRKRRVLVSLAGHLGATLVWGADFLNLETAAFRSKIGVFNRTPRIGAPVTRTSFAASANETTSAATTPVHHSGAS